MCLSTTCTKYCKGEREKLRLKCLWAKLGILSRAAVVWSSEK